MDIGIHAVAAFRDQPTGVERYTRELLEAFTAFPDVASHRFFLYTNTRPKHISRIENHDLYTLRVLRWPLMWTQLRLSYEMFSKPPDTLFVPAQALPRVLPGRTVVTVHGVEFLQVPHLYSPRHRRYLSLVTRDAVRRASQIIAVSEATKQAILEYFGEDVGNITVIHHGAPSPPKGGKSKGPWPGRQNPKSKRPYFLYVGRLESHKNVDGIVRAFSRFWKRNKHYELVLIGSPGFGSAEILQAIGSCEARDVIHVLGYVEEAKRLRFLQGAVALIHPSWAEGFGLPILEAQAARVPVLTANTTAMPEIAGDGAVFVRPGDDALLASAMERIAEDSRLRGFLIDAGVENLQRFSWEVAARKTLDVLTNGA